MEEENELVGTSDSISILEGENGGFAVGNVRLLSPTNMAKSFITTSEFDGPLQTKRIQLNQIEILQTRPNLFQPTHRKA